MEKISKKDFNNAINTLKNEILNQDRLEFTSDKEKEIYLYAYWDGICDFIGMHLPVNRIAGVNIIKGHFLLKV